MRYTRFHEWVFREEGATYVRMGLTVHAQQQLGEIVYVELPEVGKRVCAGQELAVLESTKAASDIYSPLTGKIVAVNETLLYQPALINHAAESEGWICLLEIESQEEWEQLLTKEDYQKLFSHL